ncbi:MAG: hypothetical protein KGQ70_02520 [Alphaproteobacteria bacterium]|nr:hypothetical protein [Alphaproteobacteria bacterium]
MKLSRTVALACMIFFTTAVVFPGAADAGWFGGLFGKKAAPTAPSLADIYPVQNEQSFENVAKVFHKIPFNNPELEYSILLPKDWQSKDAIQSAPLGNLGHEIISEVARYQSPVINTMTAVVVIQSIQLDHEITAKDWLRNYVYSNSCTMQGKMTAAGDKRAEANCITTTNGNVLYTHALAAINGNNLLLVEFQTPLYLTGPLEFLAKKALDSFKFILVTARPIENQKVFSFANAVKFSYPASWTPNALDIGDNNSMSMQLFNESKGKGKKKQINGMIRFVVIRRDSETSLRKAAFKLKDYFNNFLGLDFKKLVSSQRPPAASRFVFARDEIYQVSTKNATTHDQEVRLVTLGSKSWYVFAFLLTPEADDNFYTWACNTRAFDMVVKSIH